MSGNLQPVSLMPKQCVSNAEIVKDGDGNYEEKLVSMI